ncbi:MAG: T9SS type A sorting domain-containing protein [Bacteroidetes bacterium]|nr:T9SS type A sorting domain-containing protein [Bacteroidota bacterium]
MHKFKFSFLALLLSCTFSVGILAQPTQAWINEFHYDDEGGDNDEFIEVVVNEGFTDLSNFTVSKYDGGDPGGVGTVKASETLNNFTVGSTQDGLTIYYLLIQLQNGGGGLGDGIAIDYMGTLISGQFLSYEGIITGTEGPANGVTSTDIGVTESNNTPEGNSLFLEGTGTQYSDFTWTSGTATMGLVNTNQALPVELSSFSAILTENAVQLNWMTATEVNNYGFNVERKREGETWNTLGFVEGHGNSNSPKDYSFLDDDIVNAGKYMYRLKQIDNDGSYEYSQIIEVDFNSPILFELNQNYPNPFNPSTTITFTLPVNGNVNLSVYNMLGEEIQILQNGFLEAGMYSYNFNAEGLSSGFYIYKLSSNNKTQTRKMLLLK